MITWKEIVAWIKAKVKETARNIANNKSAKAAITDAKIKNMKPVSRLWLFGEPVYQAAVKTWNALRWIWKKLIK